MEDKSYQQMVRIGECNDIYRSNFNHVLLDTYDIMFSNKLKPIMANRMQFIMDYLLNDGAVENPDNVLIYGFVKTTIPTKEGAIGSIRIQVPIEDEDVYGFVFANLHAHLSIVDSVSVKRLLVRVVQPESTLVKFAQLLMDTKKDGGEDFKIVVESTNTEDSEVINVTSSLMDNTAIRWAETVFDTVLNDVIIAFSKFENPVIKIQGQELYDIHEILALFGN